MSERITIEQLEAEIADTYAKIREAWEQGWYLYWSALSAWQAGARIRLWMMNRGWIR